MSEQLDDGLAVEGVASGERGIHAEHQVGLSALQVGLRFEGGLQLDNVRNVDPFEDDSQQIDVIAVRLTILIKEYVGPKVPSVLIEQWMLLGEHLDAVRRLC